MVAAIRGEVKIGLPSPVYAFIVYALTHKAKPWCRFTRYLPSISLNGSAVAGPKGHLRGGWDGMCCVNEYVENPPG
jgi:hypothetical protein